MRVAKNGGHLRRRWSASDEVRALEMYAFRAPIREIATALGRSEGTVCVRLHMLRRARGETPRPRKSAAPRPAIVVAERQNARRPAPLTDAIFANCFASQNVRLRRAA